MSALKHEFTWKIPAPPARVFAALTKSEHLQDWFAEHAEVDPRVGGAYRFWGKYTLGTPSAGDATGKITRFEPGKLIAYTWRIEDRDSEVLFSVDADPEKAEASIVKGEHNFSQAPAINRAKEMIDDLWRFNWGNLSAHLAGGKGKLLVDYGAKEPEVALSIYIDAPPSAVFRTLIDPEKNPAMVRCCRCCRSAAGRVVAFEDGVRAGRPKGHVAALQDFGLCRERTACDFLARLAR